MWKKLEDWETLNQQQQKDLIEFVTNYLDDFLFIAVTMGKCNRMVRCFLKMCKQIGVPISEDKTEWGTARIVFLGALLDGNKCIITIPEEKRMKATKMLELMVTRKKSTVKDLEALTGYLNFLNRAIVPRRAFT